VSEDEFDWLHDQYHRVWPWLQAALDGQHPHRYTKDDVWEEIVSENAQLWPLPNAVVTTTVKTYPTGFKELRGWLVGGDLREIIDFQPTLEAWAKKQGCHEFIMAGGRDGFGRMLKGFRKIGGFYAKEL
jgi:hypothetical protein